MKLISKSFCKYIFTSLNVTANIWLKLDFRPEAKQSCPATRHIDAKGKMRYSSYSFLTSAVGGGERSASGPGRALPRGKDTRFPFDRRQGGPQSWSGHRGYRTNSLPLQGI
jgi:hypothetical protein